MRSAVALPLAGCAFHVAGDFRLPHAKIAAEIRRLGGSICKTALSKDVTHILTDTVTAGKGDVGGLLAAVPCTVVAVDENWLQRVATKMIAEYDEGVIGGNPPSFNPRFASQKRRAEGVEVFEAAPKMRKVSVREGSEVFAESGLDVLHHSVAKEQSSSKPLTSILNMTDVLKNKNSYYKLQVVASDPPSSASASASASSKTKSQKFYFVRAWGRVGCDGIGGSQVYFARFWCSYHEVCI
jgi:hypothetical protein